jgi:Fe-S-cluster containining protein
LAKAATSKIGRSGKTGNIGKVRKVGKIGNVGNVDKTDNNDGMSWARDGIRFQCQGSGKCCVSHGEYGFVFLTLGDRQRFARHLGVTTHFFTRKYCDRTNGNWHLKEDPARLECMFLKNKACSVYEARPTQCRTWPFWPEVLNSKTWKKDVLSFCPGVGRGKKWSVEEMLQISRQQQASEKELDRESLSVLRMQK